LGSRIRIRLKLKLDPDPHQKEKVGGFTAVEAQLEPWRLTMDPQNLTMEVPDPQQK